MKELMTLAQINGKVVKGTIQSIEGNELIINFEDNTFLTLRAFVDYKYETIIQTSPCLDMLNFSTTTLIDSGIVSKEEVAKFMDEREAEKKSIYGGIDVEEGGEEK